MFSGNVKHNVQFWLEYSSNHIEPRIYDYLEKYEINNFYDMSYDNILEFYCYLRDNFRGSYIVCKVYIDDKLKIEILINYTTPSITFYD